MTIQILDADQLVVEADDFNGALAIYKSQNPSYLVYPHVDQTEIHVRMPDEQGEFLDVHVLQINNTEQVDG